MNPGSVQKLSWHSSLVQVVPGQPAVPSTPIAQTSCAAVPITDPRLFDLLSSHPDTPVHCQLPAQAELLRRVGWNIRQLELRLDVSGQEDEHIEKMIDAIRASLPDCKALTALKLHVNSPREHETLLSWVCHAVFRNELQLQSLSLSLNEDALPLHCEGVAKLLQMSPGLPLLCQGPAASALVLRSLPAGASGLVLKCSGIPGEHKALSECLAKLGPTDLRLEVELADEHMDGFLRSVMAAGVCSQLALSVLTPQGFSATLQAALDGLRHEALDRLLGDCTQDRRLDTVALLARCKALGELGPMVFTLACQAACGAGLMGAPEVPIAETAYLSALHNSRVPCVVVCVMPQDASALGRCDRKKVQALKIDLGDMRASAYGGQLAPVLLMHGLRHLTVQGHHAEPAMDFLFSGKTFWPLETLCLDIEGPVHWQEDDAFAAFLNQSQVHRVICKGPFPTARLLAASRQLTDGRPPLAVDIILPSDALVADWLAGQMTEWMYLSIHITQPLALEPLKNQLLGNGKDLSTQVHLGRLRISSLSEALPVTDPLLQSFDADEIDRVVKQSKRAAQARGAKKPPYVDQKGVKESFSHLANQSRNGLKNPLEYLVHEWLDPEDYVKLSSTSLAVRSHTQYDEHSARWAAPWVRRRQAAGVPEAESHAVLEGLYGRAFADLVIDKARRAAHH